MKKDIEMLQNLGFEVLYNFSSTPYLNRFRVKKGHLSINVEIWYHGDQTKLPRPITAYYIERTVTYKTLENFNKAFEKRLRG